MVGRNISFAGEGARATHGRAAQAALLLFGATNSGRVFLDLSEGGVVIYAEMDRAQWSVVDAKSASSRV